MSDSGNVQFAKRERPTARKLNQATARYRIRAGQFMKIHHIGNTVTVVVDLDCLKARIPK